MNQTKPCPSCNNGLITIVDPKTGDLIQVQCWQCGGSGRVAK
jgi:hypothetical protein